jgi:uncharacterized protein YbjT (DUF2867 family)
VIALVRKNARATDGKVVERAVNFDSLDLGELPAGADVFCALGTTIRKAGSQEAFRRVDFGYVVSLAKQSLERGARQFTVVSSVGAEASTANFYLKTKAEMEAAISSMPFHGIHIARPSFLIGHREESRPGERIGIVAAKTLGFMLVGGLRKYKPIEADTVAAAMLAATRRGESGVHIYHYDEMQRLANSR